MNIDNYICPVCGYNKLQEKARENNAPSFEICSCCGTEFGYDDCNQESILKRRKKWIESGYEWFSEEDKPDNWNAMEQLKNIDKIQNREEISEQLQSELGKLAEEGNKYFDNNEYDKALETWKKALELLPEHKKNFSETVWFLTSIGDIYFMQGKYEDAFNNFEDAKNNLSGEGINNPFILLRLGQSAFELGKKEVATENLLRAYMLEGKEIFEEDDKKYFQFLKANVDLDN